MKRRGFIKRATTSILAAGIMGEITPSHLQAKEITNEQMLPNGPSLPKNTKMNILFVLMDDLGWKDLGCYGGHFIETPIADRLASEGIRFTQAYASPVCSPTRASILTGQNAGRHGIWEVLDVHDRPFARMKSPPNASVLKEQLRSYADILAKEAYVCGLIGKWHVGRTPQQHGFSKIDNDIKDPKLKKYAEENVDHDLGLITAHAIEFVRANKDKPFLLCVSHNAVHAPLHACKDLIIKYNKKLRKSGTTDIHPTYAAMVEKADESLGMLLDELNILGIGDNTVVVLYSDNGGLIRDMYLGEPTPMATTVLPLRDQKGSVYEGGIRVPLIVRWPGKVKPGTVCHEMVHSFDLFSTFVEIGGGKIPDNQVTDGISLVPLLEGSQKLSGREALHWHFPTSQWTRSPMGAIRKGNHKLIEHYDDDSIELFDLDDDIGETVNLLYERPEKAAELLNDLKSWRKSVGAQMPTTNPNYNPLREKELAHHEFLEPFNK